jgi:hypothetical protein
VRKPALLFLVPHCSRTGVALENTDLGGAWDRVSALVEAALLIGLTRHWTAPGPWSRRAGSEAPTAQVRPSAAATDTYDDYLSQVREHSSMRARAAQRQRHARSNDKGAAHGNRVRESSSSARYAPTICTIDDERG